MMRLDAIGLNGDKLRIEFVKHGDRYRHVLWMIDSGIEPHPLCESIEGTADDPWPPSPPLQSLRFETLSDGRHVALLLGMAGLGHWSASIEPVEGEAAFLFDIACRAIEFGAWLGSQYRSNEPLPTEADRLTLEPVQASDFPVELITASTTPRTITIRCLASPDTNRQTPRTLRWKYRLVLAQQNR